MCIAVVEKRLFQDFFDIGQRLFIQRQLVNRCIHRKQTLFRATIGIGAVTESIVLAEITNNRVCNIFSGESPQKFKGT